MTPALALISALGSGTPSIPPPAATAGYTALAFHSRFTSPIMGLVGNWLDCAGAPRPKWWISGYVGPRPNCSRVSIVRDGADHVLDIQYTVDDAASQGVALTSVDANDGYMKGVDFANGAYYQITMRVTPQSIYDNWKGAQVGSFWTWSDTYQLGLSPSSLEFDFLELWADGGDGHQYDDSFVHVYGAPGGGMALDGWTVYYPVDQTQWNTYGALVTQDSNDLSMCMYVNGAFQRCNTLLTAGTGNVVTLSQLMERNYLIMQAATGVRPVQSTMDMLVRDVQVWTEEKER